MAFDKIIATVFSLSLENVIQPGKYRKITAYVSTGISVHQLAVIFAI
jgi:hypothetical protein